MQIELNGMSLEELKALQKDVDKAIKSFEQRKLAEARAVLLAKAQELGVNIEDVFSGKAKAKAVALPKYQNPANKSETWSGRGRSPAWYKAALEGGLSKEQMLIE